MSLEISVKTNNQHEKPINTQRNKKPILMTPKDPLPMRKCCHCHGVVIGQFMSQKELRKRAEKVANYHNSRPGPKPKKKDKD